MSLPKSWKTALPGFFLALLATLFLYRQTGLAMVDIWNRSETFAHAFVVPPISLWLIWRQRAVLATLSPSPSPWFLLPLLAMAFLWLLGDLAAVNAATQLALTAMLVLVVPAALGWPVAKAIAFPLGFLFFAVPIGEFMTPKLMEWTADFTVAAVRSSGIPVFREGQQFVIPSGNWSVVEACSGIRYLMASVMVGTLFAYLNYRSLTRRWIFVGVAFVLPLVANWVRAYIIVMLGHFSGNKIATGADHLVYGWVFFGIVMMMMFMIGARWSEPDAEPPQAVDAATLALSAWGVPAWLFSWAAILLVLLTPHLALRSLLLSDGPAEFSLAAPLMGNGSWQVGATVTPKFKPVIENPSAEWQGSFQRVAADSSLVQASPVGLYVAYFRQQNYQRKLISSTHELVKSNDLVWALVGQEHRSQLVNGVALPMQAAELRHSGGASLGDESSVNDRLKVWRIYWINGRPMISEWQAKAYGAFYRLIGRGDDAAMLVFYADKLGGEALLTSFLQDNWTSLDAWLRSTREAARAGTVAPAAAAMPAMSSSVPASQP
ncbi:exosortase A [Roseateles oligotrophus]|uniref:Exosortase A n=1 Tax=Roseateles oligotrophus TaxID=1769250 RepID=A0ABT2YFA2_9BURK|nr:exosortase A [Roseateles oligotrophus]MCV2368730.1 exosortase A [Roseateles oligotrophus]